MLIIRTEGEWTMAKINELYDRDFLLWTREQASALRRAKGSNLPLDWENLAEEVESLGKSQRAELSSQVRRVLRHLFKLGASSAKNPRAGWRATIRDARAEIEELLETSPSLQRELENVVSKQSTTAAKLAVDDLESYGEAGEGIWARIGKGGYTAEQVLGDWFPESPVAHEAHR